MKKFTVLLTCVGGEFGPYMVNAIKNGAHKAKVIGIDANPLAVGRPFCDVFATAPSGDDQGYPEFIRQLVREHGIDLIIPTSDEEAMALSKLKTELQGTVIATVDPALLGQFSDKTATYKMLAEHGLPCPQWDEASTWQELLESMDRFFQKHGRIVVKPAISRGGRNIFHLQKEPCETTIRVKETYLCLETFKVEFKAEIEKHFPLVVMEELDGPVHDLDMLAWDGKPLSVVARRRLDSDSPNSGHLVLDNPDFVEMGRQLIQRFKLSWLYDCDFMFDKGGAPKIIEINPRQSGSVSISLAAGYPLLDNVISLAKNEEANIVRVGAPQTIVPYKSLLKMP